MTAPYPTHRIALETSLDATYGHAPCGDTRYARMLPSAFSWNTITEAKRYPSRATSVAKITGARLLLNAGLAASGRSTNCTWCDGTTGGCVKPPEPVTPAAAANRRVSESEACIACMVLSGSLP